MQVFFLRLFKNKASGGAGAADCEPVNTPTQLAVTAAASLGSFDRVDRLGGGATAGQLGFSPLYPLQRHSAKKMSDPREPADDRKRG